MRFGRYEIRKPIVKYVDMDLGRELYWSIRKSILEDLVKETTEKMKEDK